MSEPAQILVRHGVDLKTFREEIMPAAVPVLLKDLVADWPLVRAARESPRALANAIRALDRGRPSMLVEAPPSVGGRMFYREDMTGFNFTRRPAVISDTVERIVAQMDAPDPGMIFLESLPVADFMPDFLREHRNPLLEANVAPRIWIGNALKVQTHYDLLYNIACVVGGRRRFTLFPPDQLHNLYIGPVDFTPSGTPLSMVRFTDPDFAKYPRFVEAMRHAVQAELAPGDGIYIPYGWWHHVESLTPFNVLVNYWWNDGARWGTPYSVLLHAALTLRNLPADQRAVWANMFAELIFNGPDEGLAHLPPDRRGLLGPPTPERVKTIRETIAATMTNALKR